MPVSFHGKICEAVRDKVQKLDLDGLKTVELQKIIRHREDDKLPACYISHEGIETITTATNESNDVGYPVIVALVVAENQDLEYEDQPLLWRKQIRDAFHEKPMPLADGRVWQCLWEPLAIIDPTAFDQNLFVSAMTIRAIAREVRPR